MSAGKPKGVAHLIANCAVAREVSMLIYNILKYKRQYYKNKDDYKAYKEYESWNYLSVLTGLTKIMTFISQTKLPKTWILNQLKVVIPAIKEYDEALEQLLEQHQDTSIFKSLPSVSNTLAASLIGQLSEQEEFFKTANVLQCYGGTAPVTIQSGKKRIVVYRRACNKFLRYTLHLIAFCSLKQVA